MVRSCMASRAIQQKPILLYGTVRNLPCRSRRRFMGSHVVSQVDSHTLDNLAVVDIINKGHSNAIPIMPFMRRLTWHSATHNYILRAAHVPGKANAIADSLSRFSFQNFRLLAPDADPHPTPVPPYSELTFFI